MHEIADPLNVEMFPGGRGIIHEPKYPDPCTPGIRSPHKLILLSCKRKIPIDSTILNQGPGINKKMNGSRFNKRSRVYSAAPQVDQGYFWPATFHIAPLKSVPRPGSFYSGFVFHLLLSPIPQKSSKLIPELARAVHPFMHCYGR